jgi:hypothetical protein
MIINTSVRFKKDITFLIIYKSAYMIKNNFFSLVEFSSHICNKIFYESSCIAIVHS